MFSTYGGIDDITFLSRNMLGKSINEWNFDEVSNLVILLINVRTKSMLSITSSKESCFKQSMFPVIKSIRFIT